MEDKEKRLSELKKAHKAITSIMDTNPEWKKRERSVANYTFVSTMLLLTDDVIYQVCALRNSDAREELANAIQMLEG